MRTRKATLDDAEAIRRIVYLCYEGFGRTDDFPEDVIIGMKKRRGSPECIREHIVNEDVFVADDDGCIKGMISVKDNEITKLYVDPSCQRLGIGTQLFTYAEHFIQSRGYADMLLGTATPTALPFYERMGMRITRQRIIDCGPCVGMISWILEKTFSME
jgi:ribosomal protein S18 acetylase RimI-like enzyme